MVNPVEDTSETSLTSVADLIELAFGDDETNIVDFRFLHAILLVIARALSLLERKVMVNLTVASAYSFESTMSIAEVKVKAKGEKTKKKKSGKTETKLDDNKSSREKTLHTSDTSPEKSRNKSIRGSTDKDAVTKDFDDRLKRSDTTKMDQDPTNLEKIKKGYKKSEPQSIKESDESDSNMQLKNQSNKFTKSEEGNKKSEPQSIKESDESDTNMQLEKQSKKSNKFTKSEKGRKEPQSIKESDESETRDTQSDKKSFSKSEKENNNLQLSNDQKGQFEDHSLSFSKNSRESIKNQTKINDQKDQFEDHTLSSFKSSRESIKNQTKIVPNEYSDEKNGMAKKQGRIKTENQSQDSSEIQQEKILIVKTVPVDEGLTGTKKYKPDDAEVPQSLVTIEQFERLASTVFKLQERFGPIDVSVLEYSGILEALHKTASFSDPLAALQLSARLELAENALNQMTNLIIDLSNRTSTRQPVQDHDTSDTINATTDTTDKINKADLTTTTMSDTEKLRSKRASIITSDKEKEKLFKKQNEQQEKTMDALQSKRISKAPDTNLVSDNISTKSFKKDADAISGISVGIMGDDEMIDNIITDAKFKDLITFSEMRDRLKELKDYLMKSITTPIDRAQSTTLNALKQAKSHDIKLSTEFTNMDEVMTALEENIVRYTEKVNTVDANFSSTMTHYQEELQQMQHVLEIALDNTAEALANRETDTEAVAELNNHFTLLQIDLDRTSLMQKELKSLEKALHSDLQSLFREIEKLKLVKSDREEVENALSNKAGISSLNGKVSISQYEAVLGDIQKRIVSSYEKFNSQEIIWQKYIDEVLRDFNERAEKYQVNALKADIAVKTEMLKERLDFMLAIVGEPRTYDNSRAIVNKPCLCCSKPVDNTTEGMDIFSTMEDEKKATVLKQEKSKKKVTHIDTKRFCIPLAPIPHSLDLGTCTYTKYRVCEKLHEDVDSEQTGSDGIASSITVRALVKETNKDDNEVKNEDIELILSCPQMG